MLTLDPSGRAHETRFVVAAEWVGIHRSCARSDAEIRFVAGGTAHALDSSSEVVLCGVDLRRLALFAVDFRTDPWALRCHDCERLLRANT